MTPVGPELDGHELPVPLLEGLAVGLQHRRPLARGLHPVDGDAAPQAEGHETERADHREDSTTKHAWHLPFLGLISMA